MREQGLAHTQDDTELHIYTNIGRWQGEGGRWQGRGREKGGGGREGEGREGGREAGEGEGGGGPGRKGEEDMHYFTYLS